MALIEIGIIRRTRNRQGKVIDWILFKEPPPLNERIMLFYNDNPPPIKTAQPVGKMLMISREHERPAELIALLPEGPELESTRPKQKRQHQYEIPVTE